MTQEIKDIEIIVRNAENITITIDSRSTRDEKENDKLVRSIIFMVACNIIAAVLNLLRVWLLK